MLVPEASAAVWEQEYLLYQSMIGMYASEGSVVVVNGCLSLRDRVRLPMLSRNSNVTFCVVLRLLIGK